MGNSRLLDTHLNDVSRWLSEASVDPKSNLGQEVLKQTKLLLSSFYEIESLKKEVQELKKTTAELVSRLK